jgi:hypothetical protein
VHLGRAAGRRGAARLLILITRESCFLSREAPPRIVFASLFHTLPLAVSVLGILIASHPLTIKLTKEGPRWGGMAWRAAVLSPLPSSVLAWLALSFAQIKKNAGERVNATGAAFAKRACHAANQTCRRLFDISAQPSQPPGRDSQRLLFYYALRAKKEGLSLEKSLSCRNHLKFFGRMLFLVRGSL